MDEEKLKKYVDSREFAVPQEMIENELAFLVTELQCRRRYENLAGGGPLSYSPEELEAQMEDLRAEAVRAVKTRLVIQQIIKEQNIQVSPEELEAEAQGIAARKNVPLEMVKGFLGEVFGMLKSDLTERKAVRYICNQI